MAGYYAGKRQKTDAAQTEFFTSAEVFGIREEVQVFMDTWNEKIWLPKFKCTPRQASLIKDAMMRPYFRAHWKETFALMARSTWLRTKMRPPLSIEWYLVSDNFDKIIEGKYLDQPEQTNPIADHKVIRVGDDEDIL